MKDRKDNMNFWKKNAYYVIISICAAAIVVMSTFAIINLTGKKPAVPVIQTPIDTTPDKPVDTNPPDTDLPVSTQIIFGMPVSQVDIIKGCTNHDLPVMLDITTGYYMAHLAIDFGGASGDAVLAAYDGVVESVTTDSFAGTQITIDHGNGLKTIYKSLSDNTELTRGANVKKGDKIGEMSTSLRTELMQGDHLHFEVMENGVLINPEKYLVFEEK